MEINGINAINAYKANMIDRNNKKNTVKTNKTSKRDIVEFSVRTNDLDSVKSSAANYANASASAERIAALKKSVSEGTYHVPSEAIVKAMLEE